MEISEAIVRLRALLGWSRERLAAEVGVTAVSVDHWEKRRRAPTEAHRTRLLDVARDFGVDKLPPDSRPQVKKRWDDIVSSLTPPSVTREVRL